MDPSMMNQAPAVGAQPMADPNAGASVMPAQDPNAMGMDPMAGGMDPNAGMDMNGDGIPDDPNAMGGEEGIDGMDVQGLYDSLPDTDKDAAEGYLKYLKRKNEGNPEGDVQNTMPAEDPNAMAGQPMMESVVFSKGQLKKIHENLENGILDKKETEDKPNGTKKERKDTSKSPFGAKRFSNKQDI